MAVTKNSQKNSPTSKYATFLLLGIVASVMIVGFQNCSVDLATSTPGASTSGACGSASPAALTALQPVISGVIQTNCSSCHGVNAGSVRSGFYTADTSSDASSTAVQSFVYTQLCVRGGKAVGLKIDGSTSHGGGTFSRGGAQAAFFTYLDTYF